MSSRDDDARVLIADAALRRWEAIVDGRVEGERPPMRIVDHADQVWIFAANGAYRLDAKDEIGLNRSAVLPPGLPETLLSLIPTVHVPASVTSITRGTQMLVASESESAPSVWLDIALASVMRSWGRKATPSDALADWTMRLALPRQSTMATDAMRAELPPQPGLVLFWGPRDDPHEDLPRMMLAPLAQRLRKSADEAAALAAAWLAYNRGPLEDAQPAPRAEAQPLRWEGPVLEDGEDDDIVDAELALLTDGLLAEDGAA